MYSLSLSYRGRFRGAKLAQKKAPALLEGCLVRLMVIL
jgi:hypothetical protein